MSVRTRYRNLFALLGLACLLASGCARKSPVPDVVVAPDAGWHERAAAAEVRRYLYLRTGVLPALKEAASFSRIPDGAVAVLEKGGTLARGLDDADAAGRIAALGPEDYWLKTLARGSKRVILVAGGGGPGVLYGAYQLAEKLGVRFGLEGDVVPDARVPMPALDLDETGAPLFAVRGIQPFHDFPEGPDWWTLESYKAVLGQLPKLRMNFFGLHTYPENPNKEHGATPNAEPTVWIGREGDFRPDGTVTASYPASYQNTARGNWGYESKKTGDFHFGAGLLFERDDFGNDVMDGFSPDPATPEASNEVFDRAAAVFRNAFSLARRLGVKTSVGTETALTVPDLVKKRLADSGRDPKDPAVVKDLYKAMFERIAAAYPDRLLLVLDERRLDLGRRLARSDQGGDHGPGHGRPGLERGGPALPAGHLRLGPRPAVEQDALRPGPAQGRGHEHHQPRGRQGARRPGIRPRPGPLALGHPLDGGRPRADLAAALGRPDAPGRRRRPALRLRRAARHPLADARPLGQRPRPGPGGLGPELEHPAAPRRRRHRPHHRTIRGFQGQEDRRRRAAVRRLRGRPRPRLRLSPEGPQRDLQRDPAVRRGRRRPGPRPRLRRHHPGAEGRREPRHLRPRRAPSRPST